LKLLIIDHYANSTPARPLSQKRQDIRFYMPVYALFMHFLGRLYAPNSPIGVGELVGCAGQTLTGVGVGRIGRILAVIGINVALQER
jgi:hypothetical protein